MTNYKKDMNDYIKKSHIKAVEKFNEKLIAWANETGEELPTLYEDAYTSFTLANVHVENGWLKFKYNGKLDSERMVEWDHIDGTYYEIEGIGSIMEYIKYWRYCLRCARRYWSMDPDKLDAIQDGDIEDVDIEDNEI